MLTRIAWNRHERGYEAFSFLLREGIKNHDERATRNLTRRALKRYETDYETFYETGLRELLRGLLRDFYETRYEVSQKRQGVFKVNFKY